MSQNRIANHAWNLLTALSTHREEDETVRMYKGRAGEHATADGCRMNDR